MNGTATRRSQASSTAHAAPLRRLAPDLRLPDAAAVPERFGSVRDRIGLARQAAYVAIDFALVCAVSVAVFWLRFDLANPFGESFFSSASLWHQVWSAGYPGFLLLYAGLVVLACMSQDLYRTARDQSAWDESASVIKAVGFATALLVLFIFTSGNKEISRLVVACSGTWNAGALAGWRYTKRRYVFRRAERGEGVSRVLIVGAGKLGRTLAASFDENRQLGFEVCGSRGADAGSENSVWMSFRSL